MEYKIKILPSNDEVVAVEGQTLAHALANAGYNISASCGGKGTCGKCKIKLINGQVQGQTADESGYVLSCKAKIISDVTVFLLNDSGSGLTEFARGKAQGDKCGLGVALDIGTTTLGACLVDLASGEILEKTSALNPQSVCGADVLSRINACSNGKLSFLQTLILEKTKEIINTLAKGRKINELYVSANTTMLHLFLGVNPESIGKYPFTPVFTDTKVVDGEKLGLPVDKVCLLASASAYVGSDITAGVFALNMHEDKGISIFVDVGTNGEIVLVNNGNLYATSTAAGPALEGACIECGIGGVTGAIDKVFVKNGKIEFNTIGNAQPVGICGSGLIDLIALLLKEDIIDETGAFNDLSASDFICSLKDDRFYLTDEIYLSQKDIRQFQLAKSAISAGIETLLIEKGITVNQVQNLYVAGGLGYYMSVSNATAAGLFPKGLQEKTKVVGNTSLAGVEICLISEGADVEVQKIAQSMQIIELSFSKIFQDKYVENMFF